jgi:hypothetical protein
MELSESLAEYDHKTFKNYEGVYDGEKRETWLEKNL